MTRSKITLLVCVGPLIGLIAALAMGRPEPNVARAPPPVIVSYAPAEIIGPNPSLRGDPAARYTLVEFGDYECPACKRDHPTIKHLVADPNLSVSYVFRHMPLSFHTHARDAATWAERARTTKRFWEFHDKLMEAQFGSKTNVAEQLATGVGIVKRSGKMARSSPEEQRIRLDEAMADKLKIISTPTYYLCSKDGRVYHLGELSQATTIMKDGGR